MPAADPGLTAILASLPLFSILDAEARVGLAERFTLLTGEEAAARSQDDGLYVVLSAGESGEGESARPGALAGEVAFLTRERTGGGSARFGSTARVARLDPEAFEDYGREFPGAYNELLVRLQERVHRIWLESALLQSELFGDFSRADMSELQAELELVRLARGEVLMQQGDVGNSLYLVIHGRLRVVKQIAGNEVLLAELGCGETVGEMAVLSGEPRSATVYAMRDSQLAKLSNHGFERLLLRSPKLVLRNVGGALVKRLRKQPEDGSLIGSKLATIAIIGVQAGFRRPDVVTRLTGAFEELGQTATITSERVDTALGKPGISQCSPDSSDGYRLVEWLNGREVENQFVLYVADPDASEWTQRCLRQADHILLLADAESAPAISEFEASLLESTNRRAAASRSLILIHPEGTRQPSGTVRWLNPRPALDRHYHVRSDRQADFQRVARFLTGRALGLVLGGGFARALAHVGVFRALDEAGIAVDAFGGTSMGAFVAGLRVKGWDYDQILKQVADGCTQLFDDLTFPYIAFHRGGKISRLIEELCEDTCIEDMWIPYFCLTANLNRAEQALHSRGRLSRMIMATTRAPGIYPPIVHQGELHVDGGLANNVPVDQMRQFLGGGIVIGVDVSPPHELNLIEDFGVEVNGLNALWGRFNPWEKMQKRPYVPSILLVLMRTIEFGGLAFKQTIARQADLYLSPPLLQFKRTDFPLVEKMADVTQEYTREEIRKWLAGERRPARTPFVAAKGA